MSFNKIKLKYFSCLLTLFLITLSITSCKSSQEDNNPSGKLLSYNGCKTSSKQNSANNNRGQAIEQYNQNQECLQYFYDGQILSLTHINTVFNCCIDGVKHEIQFNNNTITIIEREINPNCKCLCLYDTNYELKDIKPDIYTLIFKNGNKEFTLTIDLRESRQGIECISREDYPYSL